MALIADLALEIAAFLSGFPRTVGSYPPGNAAFASGSPAAQLLRYLAHLL
jgi:hypothetical protein